MYLNENIYKKVNFFELVSKTIIDIKVDEGNEDIVTFICKDETKYIMVHSSHCCEHVYIAEIIGDLNDLINTPIINVQILSNENNTIDKSVIRKLEDKEKDYISGMEWGFDYEHLYKEWTFYKITTNKGDVVFRWCGVTDSCYSIDVGFYEIVDNEVYN